MLIDLNCVDMTVNLQTWVMLLDFITISPSLEEKVVFGSQAVTEFLNELSDPNIYMTITVSLCRIFRTRHGDSHSNREGACGRDMHSSSV